MKKTPKYKGLVIQETQTGEVIEFRSNRKSQTAKEWARELERYLCGEKIGREWAIISRIGGII